MKVSSKWRADSTLSAVSFGKTLNFDVASQCIGGTDINQHNVGIALCCLCFGFQGFFIITCLNYD